MQRSNSCHCVTPATAATAATVASCVTPATSATIVNFMQIYLTEFLIDFWMNVESRLSEGDRGRGWEGEDVRGRGMCNWHRTLK